jgi:hypothetical protein
MWDNVLQLSSIARGFESLSDAGNRLAVEGDNVLLVDLTHMREMTGQPQ